MTATNHRAEVAEPGAHEVIEVRVTDIKRLFKELDPSPFLDKDLDVEAEEFIVGWAKDLRRDAQLALRVHVTGGAIPAGDEAEHLQEAIRAFFRGRAERSSRRLRHLFRMGRTALMIGVAALAALAVIGDFLGKSFGGEGSRVGGILRESLLIGGWVAMWRPLEIFLYDWWPIRAESRLYERLGAMTVRIVGQSGDSSKAVTPARQS